MGSSTRKQRGTRTTSLVAVLAWGAALALSIGCGSEVRGPDGEPIDETSGGNDDNDDGTPCAVCSSIGASAHFGFGRPWCPGEEAKFNALRACACDVATCRDSAPLGSSPCLTDSGNDGTICEGGAVFDRCRQCLRERCTEAATACGIKSG